MAELKLSESRDLTRPSPKEW
ncbi:BnaC03g48690D [Brassica napus]|uniref:BnaA06g24890D protein n=1 Tax=Brassica napus TaxID=3708 RepID=A0A078F2K2_BRANA|nr:BnaA06g24890D [Brassica napus]CDY36510.1 BnaC03g48690D [Brassica napus]